MSEWIKCSERLPEHGQTVLGFWEHENMQDRNDQQYRRKVTYFRHGWTDFEHTLNAPTHWMPLPEPPKEMT